MKRISVTLWVLCLVATVSWAQQRAPQHRTVYIPQTVYQGPTIDYKYHTGVARLRDGSLLMGRFRATGKSAFIYRASSQAGRQRIGASMIQRLVLAGADTLVTDRKDSTVFVRLGNRLFRQLANGSTMVLDRSFTVDEDRGTIGARLFVLDENEKLHKFASLKRLNDWFYQFQEKSGKKVTDDFLNKSEIVKAVAQLNRN